MKAGVKYKVATRHQFEGEYVETVTDDDENPIAHIFDTGGKSKGGKATLRKVPARSFIGATKVK